MNVGIEQRTQMVADMVRTLLSTFDPDDNNPLYLLKPLQEEESKVYGSDGPIQLPDGSYQMFEHLRVTKKADQIVDDIIHFVRMEHSDHYEDEKK